MKRLADRRTILLAVATVAAAVGARADAGSATDLGVTVGFEGGGLVPKGRLAVYLDGPGVRQQGAARTSADSDGGSREINLSLTLPSGTDKSSPQQIVARLQRADGWLLARGSAQLDGSAPIVITLYTVMH